MQECKVVMTKVSKECEDYNDSIKGLMNIFHDIAQKLRCCFFLGGGDCQKVTLDHGV